MAETLTALSHVLQQRHDKKEGPAVETLLSLSESASCGSSGSMEDNGHGWLHPVDAPEVAFCLSACRESATPIAPFALDASSLPAPLSLDLSRLNAVREYMTDDLIITVESGMTVGQLRQTIHPAGQDLSIDLPDSWRLADVVMLDPVGLETGLRRGVKEIVLGLEVAATDGTLTKCGGKVVKNVTGYDLNKFYVGSQYAVVVPTAVTLRLVARPAQTRWRRVAVGDLQAASTLSHQLLQAPSTTLSALEWLPQPDALALWPEDDWLGNLPVDGWIGHCRSQGLLPLVEGFAEQWSQVLESVAVLSRDEWQVPAGETTLRLLAGWDRPALWIEAFLPYGVWPEILKPFNWPVAPHQTQARPAASYISWQWNQTDWQEMPLEAWQAVFQQLQERVRQAQGYLRVMQAPAGWEALFRQFNLPVDPIALRLNTQLKDSYDPKRILYSRRLVL